MTRNFATVEAAQRHYDEVYKNRRVKIETVDGDELTGTVLAESIDGGVGEHGEVYSLSVLVQVDQLIEAYWRYVDQVVLV